MQEVIGVCGQTIAARTHRRLVQDDLRQDILVSVHGEGVQIDFGQVLQNISAVCFFDQFVSETFGLHLRFVSARTADTAADTGHTFDEVCL